MRKFVNLARTTPKGFAEWCKVKKVRKTIKPTKQRRAKARKP